MQAIVEQISQLFLSYNDYLSKNININSVDKKSLDKLLFDGFLNQNVPKTKTKAKTSYQNFFQIKRKTLSEQNPQLAFGAISKMISTEWRSMSKTEKDTFKTINITEDTNNVDEKSTDNTSIVFEVSTNHKKLNEPLPSSIERYFIENSDNESDVDDNDNDDDVYEEHINDEDPRFGHNDIEDDNNDDRGNDDEDDQSIENDKDDDDDDDDDLDSLNFTFDDD